MTLPIDAINTLLDMVRGTTQFDLITAIKAALEIAEYIKSVFSTESTAEIDKSMDLETALATVTSQHSAGAVTAQAIPTQLLMFIVQLVMEWIAKKLESGS